VPLLSQRRCADHDHAVSDHGRWQSRLAGWRAWLAGWRAWLAGWRAWLAGWRARLPWCRLGKELLLTLILAVSYEALRSGMVQSGSVATRHARWLAHLETNIWLFQEKAVQAAFLHVPDIVRGFNLYYGGTHFLVPAAALIWLALRHRERYARARTALAAITGLAFICFWLFPMAPPRLLQGHFGIIDTLETLGKSGHAEKSLISAAGDIYASMPSLHLAWALWCTLALYPAVRNRMLRAVLVAYPVMTTLVVVTTGNHFFLDAVAGALLAAITWVAVTWMSKLLGGAALKARSRYRARQLADHRPAPSAVASGLGRVPDGRPGQLPRGGPTTSAISKPRRRLRAALACLPEWLASKIIQQAGRAARCKHP
jgi:PAP2 superfamily